ncbi:hypothetical protein D3C80_1771930 [compost metagenome]
MVRFGASQGNDDDVVFLALITVDGLDLYQLAELLRPVFLGKPLSHQFSLIEIHADDPDWRLLRLGHLLGHARAKLGVLCDFFQQPYDRICFSIVRKAQRAAVVGFLA